jgi:hypothetical protein
MKSILDSPELRQDLIDKGALALSRFSMDQTATSLQKLYGKTAAFAFQDHQLVERQYQSVRE